jgi:hypothetical protein
MSLRKQAEENSPGRKPGVYTPNDDVSPGGATESLRFDSTPDSN